MTGVLLLLLTAAQATPAQLGPPAGCTAIHLRPTGTQCYTTEVDEVAYLAKVSIWDDSRPGRPANFCLPARYGRAAFGAEAWGQAGTDLLVARLVGDSGNATMQVVAVGLGWKMSGYGLVLFETVDYTIGGRHLLGRIARGREGLRLSYDYVDAPYMGPERPTSKESWTMDLSWNPETSQYDRGSSGAGGGTQGPGISGRAGLARRAAFGLGVSEACDGTDGLMLATGVMAIMPGPSGPRR